jgi:hypothetical protein
MGYAVAPAECDHRPMGTHQIAQAVELVRALRHELHEMTTQLACVERQDVTVRNGRACAVRLEAAALRRDIKEAEFLIDRLQRRYLNGDGESGIRGSQLSSGSAGSRRW